MLGIMLARSSHCKITWNSSLVHWRWLTFSNTDGKPKLNVPGECPMLEFLLFIFTFTICLYHSPSWKGLESAYDKVDLHKEFNKVEVENQDSGKEKKNRENVSSTETWEKYPRIYVEQQRHPNKQINLEEEKTNLEASYLLPSNYNIKLQ